MNALFEVTELVADTGGEPRMSAALLSERLGMARVQIMTNLIERNDAAMRHFGEYLRTVRKNPSAKGGRPTKD